LIFSTQAAIFFLRERRHFWNSRPSLFLIAGSVFGMGTTAVLTLGGILMPPIRPFLLLVTVAAGVVYFACLDWLKIWLFSWFDLR
jgi:H+-transporting ATPase